MHGETLKDATNFRFSPCHFP